MPFTFKLSQRLARMKLPLAVAAAAFAACEQPVRITDPTPPNSSVVQVESLPNTTIPRVRPHAGRRQRRRRGALERVRRSDHGGRFVQR